MRLVPPPRRQRGGHTVRLASGLVTCLLLSGLAPAGVAAAPLDSSVPASDLVAEVAAGHSVDRTTIRVIGDLDLSSTDHASHVFRCTNCTFTGSFIASNVIFDRIVDLSGAEIHGRLDLSGAVFRDAFVMAATPERASNVAGPATFTLASFARRAGFEAASFGAAVDFRGAQFLATSSFADSEIAGPVLFDDASFKGDADFASSPGAPSSDGTGASTPGPPSDLDCPTGSRHAFEAPASFAEATFDGAADFRERCFGSDVTFAATHFVSADFGLAAFRGRAVVDGASVTDGLSFRSALFADELSAQRMLIGGTADFDGAVFIRSLRLFRTTVLGLASFQEILIGGTIEIGGAQFARLHIDLDELDHVVGEADRERALAMIESTARADGDLGLANDAAFMGAQMRAREDSGIQQVGDVLAREAGGYLVKPSYPARAILLLLLLGTAVRTLLQILPRRPGRSGTAPPAQGSNPTDTSDQAQGHASRVGPGRKRQAATAAELLRRHGSAALKRVLDLCLFVARASATSLRAAIRARPSDIAEGERNRLRAYLSAAIAASEWLSFKVLEAVLVIGLANSNPTLKQLLEAVTR